VSDNKLTARSPLGGAQLDFDGVALAEETALGIVSIATPLGGDEALSRAVSDAYAAEVPEIGRAALADTGKARLLRLAPDQMFLLVADAGDNPVANVADGLGEAAYLTDQSDGWAMLRISGAKSRTALERICPLDLHVDAFPGGHVARTVMEHMGVIILHEDPDTFLLLSPRSSAASFLHAVETSVRNVT